MRKISLNTFRYGLVILYFYTLIHKLMDLSFLEENLRKSALLTDYAQSVKYILPAIEILVIILLAVNKLALKGLYFSLLLLLSFTFYLIALNNFSFFEGCSCGGIFNEMDYQTHVFVNIAFIVLNVIAIILYDPNDLI
ncbi:hypothetical protein QNH98_17170 [Myroides sp. mNGS23_01]|nr:MauE/DoxX family redox-associated membrane protein [Myroides sp. mNGS23_01]WHT38698.1 hypothetical protein QNH98_17170 [Myroides sp. mNGS23_01]